jgi:hypothetical protein
MAFIGNSEKLSDSGAQFFEFIICFPLLNLYPRKETQTIVGSLAE